jgi:hypothetical protein
LRQAQLKIRAVGKGDNLYGLVRLEARKRHEEEKSQDNRTRLFECVLMTVLTHSRPMAKVRESFHIWIIRRINIDSDGQHAPDHPANR